jgi:hypothetical protein
VYPLKINRRFRGTIYLILAGFLLDFFFHPEDAGDMILRHAG